LIGSTHSKRFVKGATLVIKRNTIATLIALVLVALPLSSLAQTRAESATVKPAKRKLNDITGTWLVTVAVDEASAANLPAAARRFVRESATTLAPFNGTETFHDDGTFAENSLADYLPPVGTPGRGEWTKTADHEFALTFYGVTFVSFSDPTVIGTYRVRSKIILDQSGLTFNAPALIDIFDPAGNPVVSIPATAQGRRATLEPLP
jgi:hypothetical protein